MAYTVAQIRRLAGSGTYMETIPVQQTIVNTPSPFDPDNSKSDFQDFALKTQTGYSFEAGQVYYLRLSVLRVPSGYYWKGQPGNNSNYKDADVLRFSLHLRINDDISRREQTVNLNQSFQVDPIETNNLQNILYTYTTVFVPKQTCQVLVLRLQRISYDVLAKPRNWLLKEYEVEDGSYVIKTNWIDGNQYTVYTSENDTTGEGREVTGTERIIYVQANGDICKLKEILPNNLKGLLKIGFQARPGTLIVVNKAPIRIGRSGIYEINNGTRINSVMITAPMGYDNNNIDAFLLDYAYDKES